MQEIQGVVVRISRGIPALFAGSLSALCLIAPAKDEFSEDEPGDLYQWLSGFFCGFILRRLTYRD